MMRLNVLASLSACQGLRSLQGEAGRFGIVNPHVASRGPKIRSPSYRACVVLLKPCPAPPGARMPEVAARPCGRRASVPTKLLALSAKQVQWQAQRTGGSSGRTAVWRGGGMVGSARGDSQTTGVALQ